MNQFNVQIEFDADKFPQYASLNDYKNGVWNSSNELSEISADAVYNLVSVGVSPTRVLDLLAKNLEIEGCDLLMLKGEDNLQEIYYINELGKICTLDLGYTL